MGTTLADAVEAVARELAEARGRLRGTGVDVTTGHVQVALAVGFRDDGGIPGTPRRVVVADPAPGDRIHRVTLSLRVSSAGPGMWADAADMVTWTPQPADDSAHLHGLADI